MSQQKTSTRRNSQSGEYQSRGKRRSSLSVLNESEEQGSEKSSIEGNLSQGKRGKILKALLTPLRRKKKTVTRHRKKDASNTQQFLDTSLRLPAAIKPNIAPFLTPGSQSQARRHSSREFTATTRARLRQQRASINPAGILYQIPDSYDESIANLEESFDGGWVEAGNQSIDWSKVLKDMQELDPHDSGLSQDAIPLTPSPGSLVPKSILNKSYSSATSSVTIQPPPFLSSSPVRTTGKETSPRITGIPTMVTTGEEDPGIPPISEAEERTPNTKKQDLSYFLGHIERQKERTKRIQEGRDASGHEEELPGTVLPPEEKEAAAVTDTPLTISSRTETGLGLPAPPLTRDRSKEEEEG